MHSTVAASTSGIEMTTTMPVRTPRLIRLTISTMAMASATASTKSSIERLTACGMLATSTSFNPAGSEACNRCGLRVERLSERNHIAGRRHGDADTEYILAVEAHVFGGRIGISAMDFGDIAEAQRAAVDTDQHVGQLLGVLELPARAHEYPVVGGGEDAGAGHRILGIDGIGDLLDRESELRELRVGDFHVDALLLVSDEIDLVDVRHPQQFGAQPLRIVIQLARREAVALERVDVGVDVAELVVEVGTLDSGRQGIGDVAHLLPNLIPGIRHLRGGHGVLDVEEQCGLAGPRIAAQEVQAGRLLKLARDPVGDLLLNLPRRRTGPDGPNDHDLEREGRIFRLREPAVRQHAEERDQRKNEYHQRAVVERPAREIEAKIPRGGTHGVCPASAALSPSPSNRGFTGFTRSPS